jgi:serine/threonine protein kinase
VKVLDFGLARLEEATSVTGVGLALGTPSFMAPEQANGRTKDIDARTDIFAVGATAFRILSGRGVHEADGVLELVARMGTLPAPKLREIAPQVSEPVARIVDRALEFKQEDRYPSAGEMRADVQRALASLSPPPPPSIDDKPASLRSVAATTGVVDASPPRRRSLAPFVLALLVGAGLVLVFVPQARDHAMPNAVGDLFSARPGTSASGSAPPLSSAPASASAVASASPPLLLDDASAETALDSTLDAASDAPLDASLDASLHAALDASDEDEEDDDDPDASDVVPFIPGRDAAASPAAAHPAAKHPRATPRKHGKPPRKRRRRTR